MLARTLHTARRLFVQVKNLTEFQTATKANPNHIIQFTASWCGPCKQLSPILYKKQNQAQGKWTVIKIDVDENGNSQICQQYQIESIPKLVFVKNGQQVEESLGSVTSNNLDQLIKLIH